MPESLVWKKTGLMFGDWTQGPNSDSIFEFSSSLPISDRVQNNGSLYLHSFVVREGKSPDPSAGKAMFSKKWTAYKKQRLNKFMKRKYKKTSNLLTGATDKTEEEQAKAELGLTEIISQWHPNITLNVVYDYTPWVPGQVPPPLDEFVEFTPSLQNYKPILWINDYWNLNRDYQPINSRFDKKYEIFFKFEIFLAQHSGPEPDHHLPAALHVQVVDVLRPAAQEQVQCSRQPDGGGGG